MEQKVLSSLDELILQYKRRAPTLEKMKERLQQLEERIVKLENRKK